MFDKFQRLRPKLGQRRGGSVGYPSLDDPALVPLETLPGRDHYEFPAGERPPWQWRVRGLYPGWSR